MAKRSKPPPTLHILHDDREKLILPLDRQAEVASITRRRLQTGDYTTAALYDGKYCVVERKSLIDWGKSASAKNFKAEIERSREFKEFHLVIAATLDQVINYPWGLPLPKSVKSKIRINGAYLLSRMISLTAENPHLSIWLADTETNAAKLVVAILKQAEARYLTPQPPAYNPEKESA